MSGWDDPTGAPWYAVGICDRCNRRFLLHELIEDGNLPGLRVCRDDWDELDPYRLPARQTEDITLPFVRPDVPIEVTSCVHAYELPGYVVTEDGLYYVITENDVYVITQGESALTTELDEALAVSVSTLPECNVLLVVEPWAS